MGWVDAVSKVIGQTAQFVYPSKSLPKMLCVDYCWYERPTHLKNANKWMCRSAVYTVTIMCDQGLYNNTSIVRLDGYWCSYIYIRIFRLGGTYLLFSWIWVFITDDKFMYKIFLFFEKKETASIYTCLSIRWFSRMIV